MTPVAPINTKWRVGQVYRDTAGWKREEDEFLRWLRSGDKTLANTGGVRYRDFTAGKVRDPETGGLVPAFFVLVTAESHSQFHNPWQDIVDQVGGDIYYWGDAKHGEKRRSYADFPGNARIEAANNLRLTGDRKLTPPILHFTKPGVGKIRFNGLCWLSDVRQMWFDDHGKPVKNLRLLLSILDTDEVDAAWLRERAVSADIARADKLAPAVWRDALRGKIRKRHLWAQKIRPVRDQLPPPGSEEAHILAEIRALSAEEFENFTVALIDKLPEIVTGLNHQVVRTQRTSDHGVDFFGRFTLPWPIAYEIEFVGEAKRYSSPVTPEKVSRLVARLGRGQYGLFFTTSAYSERAQKEVIMDRYPVRLFSGLDIVNLLKAGNCTSSGKLLPEWKKVAIQRPEGVLSDGLVTSVT